MRVGFVLPRTSSRRVGAMKIIYGLADRLAERGHQVTLAHPATGMCGGGPHPWHQPQPGVRSLATPDLSRWWPGPAQDWVIATSWQTVPWVAAYPARAGRRLYFLQDYETYRLGGAAERAAIRATLGVGWPTVVTSPPLRRLATAHARGLVVEIPCAIDTARYTLRMGLSDPRRRLVGFPARCERAKRTRDAVHALQELRAKTGLGLGAWCFGHDPIPGLPEWITHHATPTDQALASLYNQSAVFVVPSECEGFGLPGLEAMACGAALVSARNGGVDAYADTHTALLCPPRDPAALATAVERLLADDPLRRRLAVAGARQAARFTWEATTTMFEQVLHQPNHPPAGR